MIIINENTPAIDIQTTLLVVLLFPPEVEPSVADGPSACFPGFCSGDVPEDGAPGSGGAGAGLKGDGGEGNGETVVLNGFPSFLHIKYQHFNESNNLTGNFLTYSSQNNKISVASKYI